MGRGRRYTASEIRFNLLEVTKDRRTEWRSRIAHLERVVEGTAMDTSDVDAREELERLRSQLAAEDDKFQRWKAENIRRRHNYVPFIMSLLKTLAARGHLVTMLDEAKRVQDDKKKARKG